jgi:hypothetical protein
LYYALWWDLGSDGLTWEAFNEYLTEVQGEDVIKVTINGLTSGTNYQFKYRSQNIHGWSTGFSPSVVMMTLTVPVKVIDLTTTIINSKARIFWTEPYSGGVGIHILGYTIEIMAKDGTFHQDPECDGNSAEVIAQQHCEILASKLTAEPYNLKIGDLIVARIKA